jgi:hypothetical protein
LLPVEYFHVVFTVPEQIAALAYQNKEVVYGILFRAYLGRYTHRVAISNNRLLDIDDGQVTLRWKDYRRHDQAKVMTLEADEFIRRFLLHILPDSFQRIRHHGFLANRYRQAKLALCRQLAGVALTLTGSSSSRTNPIIAISTKN